ncbi:MAG: gliding motility-associated-like protein [Saprospiraceae bacterium]|jgi:gliding motility-associated-like protein
MSNFIKIQTLKTSIFLFLLGLTFGLNAQISVTFETSAPSCHNYTNGIATATATGGSEPYTYNWSNGQNGATNSGLSAGSYSLNVSDATGASISDSVTVTASEVLIASVDFDGDVCAAYTTGSLSGSVIGGTPPYSYLWSNGGTESNIDGLAPGGYYLTVSDANACETVAFYEVTAAFSVDVSTLDIVCNDFCDASAQANITGGTAPYTYIWNTGMTGSVAFPLPVGNYCVTATDGNGCVATDCGTIVEPPAIETSIILTGDCDGNSDISATVTVTGGVPEYTINWNNGATGNSISGLQALTNYSVTITDANGCVDVESITTGSLSQLSITVSSENETCAGENDGSSTIIPGGGVAPYIITWSTGSNSETINDLAPGNYDVTVNDINGCTGIQTVIVAEGTTVYVSTETTASACGDNGTGSISLVPSGGMAPYFFIYEDGIGNPMSGQVSNLTAGTYNVTVGDAEGCTDITQVNVEAGVNIDLSTSSIPSDCGDVGTGSILVEPTTGTGPFTYTYENGIGNPDSGQVTNLAAGDYNVTVTDDNGCSNATTINVDEISVFTLNTSTTNASCDDVPDGSAVVSVSSDAAQPVTYIWDNGSEEDNAGDAVAGDYTVTVTDANGCTNIETITVEADNDINADIIITPGDCTGNMISVTVSAISIANIDSYLYTTNNGDTFMTPVFALDIPVGEMVTITLLVENAAGCSGESENTFTAASFEPFVPETFEACLGEDLMASASSGVDDTYEWTSDDNIFIGATNIANPVINTSTAGQFPAEVTITNAQGCSVIEAVTITISDTEIMPDPALVSSTQDCDGTLLDFTNANSSADNYEWIFDYPNGEIVPGGAAGSYDFLEAGVYQVALIPTVSCADTVIIEVEVVEPQISEFTFETNCEDGFVVVFTDMSSNPGGITNWSWDINGTIYDQQNPSVEFETAGTINAILTVSYGDDCDITTMQPVEVAPFNPPTPTSEMVDCGGGNAMELFPNSNTDYDYEWSPAGGLSDPNVPNPTATVTVTTIYMVTITDPETGCTESSEVTVIVPDELISPMLGNISLCQSEDETVDATVAGGVIYTWSDDENFNNILSQEAVYGFTVSEVETIYYILIEDEFGCTISESFTAGVYPINFDFGSIQLICEGDVTTYELPDGLTVDWGGDDPSDTPIFEEDFFVGTITNEANCSLQDTLFAEAVIITEGLEIAADPDTILLGDVSELFVTPDDRFTYDWDNGETLNVSDIHNPTATPEETTTYTVTITDDDGCEGELDVEVVVENNCEPFLYFPNAFTPDADGLNDVLYVEGLSLDEVFFAIYNRWGEKVYESNDITEGWDGKFNDEVVCPDVYGYYLRVRCTDGNEIVRKGNVSVLR